MKSLHSIRILLGFVVFQSAVSAGKANVLFIVYVGLAYRCKVQRGNFELAMEDLRASIQWFEARAATY